MDLKLKITQKEGTNMSSLVKQMCALKCRIKVDAQEGDLSIVGMDDNSIENVIDSIDEAFNIVGVDIVPTVEVPEPVVTEESLEIAKIEFSNVEVEEQVNKLMRIIYWAMYSSKAHSRDICQYLMATGTEIAMKYNPREVPKFSVGDVVVCNYGNHLSGEISGGHVHAIVCDVDEEGMIYAAPITKAKLDGDLQKYLPFEAKVDVDYTVSRYTGGTVLLKKGGYIRPERIQDVVGTARPEFFNKLLAILPTTIQFSHDDYAEKLSEKYGDVDNDDNMLFDGLGEIPGEETSGESVSEAPAEETSGESVTEAPAEETAGESVSETPAEETSGESVTEAPAEETSGESTTETPVEEGSGESTAETPVEESSGESTEESPTSDSSTEDVNEDKPSNNTKKPSAEDYVAELLASSLASLDKSKPVVEQIDMFLNGIGFQTNEKIIKQSFVAACEVKKVGYESIILELRNVYPKIREEIIKATMREEFKKWLTMYPEAKEKYPKISFMVLLKVFAKKMR